MQEVINISKEKIRYITVNHPTKKRKACLKQHN